MRLLAPLVSGLCIYLAVGYLLGLIPSIRLGSKRFETRRDWLVQAGVTVSPVRFWFICAAVGLAGFGFGFLLTGLPTISVAVGVALAWIPWLVVSRRRNERLASVRESWPDGLRDLVASIGAGASVARALDSLAETGPEPLRAALSRYPLLARSLGVIPALEVIRGQLADPTSDRVIEVLILAHERGGTLVGEILSDLADMTSRDRWTEEQIRSATLEQKINARVVFVLPWLVLVALTASSAAYRQFYASSAGMLVVGVAAAASLLGMLLVVRLGREPEEPRVLTGGQP